MGHSQMYNSPLTRKSYNLYADTIANGCCRTRLQHIGGAFETVESTTYPTHLAFFDLCTVPHKITRPTLDVFITVVYITDDETKGLRQLSAH